MMECCCIDQKEIEENIRRIRERIEEAALAAGRDQAGVRLMAVTKTVPAERVNAALAAGITLLGENRVQECCEKYQKYHCKADTIHFIGHLQTNKIRDIIDKIGMVESVDSAHLALALQRECEKQGKTLPVLLQVNIGQEETKGGFSPKEMQQSLLEQIGESCPALEIRGLMAIPPKTGGDFWLGKMQELYEKMKAGGAAFTILSMGMSGDYEQAVRYGSTELRIGSAIFGQRK